MFYHVSRNDVLFVNFDTLFAFHLELANNTFLY